jgi:MFS family permease
MAIAILSAVVFLFAESVAWLYAGGILSGISIGIATGTGTAWLAELIGRKDKSLATAIATSVNFLGLATSALIAGILAQYAAWPLRLPLIIYVAALVMVTALIWRTRETVEQPRGLQRISLRPNVSVPAEIAPNSPRRPSPDLAQWRWSASLRRSDQRCSHKICM